MGKIEAIYKCRHCGGLISTQNKGGFPSYKIPLILESTHCPHCCLFTSNEATITVVADLIKQIRRK